MGETVLPKTFRNKTTYKKVQLPLWYIYPKEIREMIRSSLLPFSLTSPLSKVLYVSRIGPRYMETKEEGRKKFYHEVKRVPPREIQNGLREKTFQWFGMPLPFKIWFTQVVHIVNTYYFFLVSRGECWQFWKDFQQSKRRRFSRYIWISFLSRDRYN